MEMKKCGRVNNNPVDSLTFRSLQFLVKFKKLEELEVLSYFCSDGNFFKVQIFIFYLSLCFKCVDDLKTVAKICKLKSLHLVLNNVTAVGIQRLTKLKCLEYFEFKTGDMSKGRISDDCLRFLPLLKLNGSKVDVPAKVCSWHTLRPDMQRGMQLEHYIVGDKLHIAEEM